jgi:hypothetical protein
MEAHVVEKNIKNNLNSNELLISNLVFSALKTSKQHLTRPANPEWIEHAGQLLFTSCLSKTFEKDRALSELVALGFKTDTIVDHCIPVAATLLGDGWVNDTLSFSECTIGTSNLQILLKFIGQNRERVCDETSGNRYLICSHETEQHTLGALIIGDMLRRKGHSLKVQLSTNYDEVCRLQNNSHYEAIFFSCASYLSIRETAKCVRQVKKTLKQSVPIFLGGSNIEEISQGVDLCCFDLVTNSLSAVNDYVSNKKKRELALNAGALIQ